MSSNTTGSIYNCSKVDRAAERVEGSDIDIAMERRWAKITRESVVSSSCSLKVAGAVVLDSVVGCAMSNVVKGPRGPVGYRASRTTGQWRRDPSCMGLFAGPMQDQIAPTYS